MKKTKMAKQEYSSISYESGLNVRSHVCGVWPAKKWTHAGTSHVCVRARTHLRSPPFQNLPLWFMSFSSHFHFFVLVCFFIIFHLRLACLALQRENMVQKIMQPFFVFGNFVNQNEKWIMGWKVHSSQKVFHFDSVLKKMCQITILHLWFVTV